MLIWRGLQPRTLAALLVAVAEARRTREGAPGTVGEGKVVNGPGRDVWPGEPPAADR